MLGKKRPVLALATAFLAGTTVAIAAPVVAADAGTAYMQAMKKMDTDMAKAPMTGDADHDFAAMMAPHHQGAIDMAKIELQYGKDKMLRDMAKKTVESQTKERKMMQDWLAKHGKTQR